LKPDDDTGRTAAINAFVRVHALGALIDHQSDEASVDDGGGLFEGIALGTPAADELGAIALENLIQPHERTSKAFGVAFLGAQAEQGDALDPKCLHFHCLVLSFDS